MLVESFLTNSNLEKINFDSDQEWLDFRKNRIGASDASIILGTSKWKDNSGRIKTPRFLWEEKLGLIESSCDNYATQYGKRMEEPARQAYERMKGVLVSPTVIVNKKYPFFMASLDGLSLDETIAVEIKNPSLENHEEAKAGVVPKKYIAQVQLQLLVSELPSIDYFSFYKGDAALVTVVRDEEYLKMLNQKLLDFWKCVMDLKEPPLTSYDFEEKFEDWEQVAKKLWEVKEAKKNLSLEEENLEKELMKLSMGKNSKSKNFSFGYTVVKGSVDYKSIPELKSVNLENFRKKCSTRWTLKKII